MEALKELLQFLEPAQRIDLKVVALTHVLGLTGSTDGKAAILAVPDICNALFKLCLDKQLTVAKDAVLCLINLTAEEADANAIFEIATTSVPCFAIVQVAIEKILDENSELADPWSMVLSNLTRVEQLASNILNELEKDEQKLPTLVKAFAVVDYNKKKANLHYLAPVFCNLTQTSAGRKLFCDSKYDLLDKVLPFTTYDTSLLRRGGTIGFLKNICFDPAYHDVIMCEKNNILYLILYPLCGPEEFIDEENDKLPIELQYLPETKTREEDPDLRKMLLESLLQLCATKRYRELLRDKGVYEILREYHKWEHTTGKDKNCFLACENVVDILIRKEEEIGLDNYRELEVPTDMTEKFVKEDTDYLNDSL